MELMMVSPQLIIRLFPVHCKGKAAKTVWMEGNITITMPEGETLQFSLCFAGKKLQKCCGLGGSGLKTTRGRNSDPSERLALLKRNIDVIRIGVRRRLVRFPN